ncbi:DEAD/DEAH box helicase [Paenibacillus sp. sgz500958]|uniref:DEAD/DEAH box helicase n=1 Tax=Paenibacillus sp. sgz500958 TaxID=3242475 RepID=UPI0036D3FC86
MLLEVGKQIELPRLMAPREKYRIGEALLVLDSKQFRTINKITKVQFLGKRYDNLYELDSGEKVLIVEKGIKQIPDVIEVDGILRLKDGELIWIWHRSYTSDQETPTVQYRDKATRDWQHKFRFKEELIDGVTGKVITKGLRPPQIGALHAIGAHWSISSQPATIIMPTGTGKTETMLGTLVNYIRGCVLVVVPSRALRDQIARKFLELGLLKHLGNIPKNSKNPKVGILKHRPLNKYELGIFETCNVVVATISTVAQGNAIKLMNDIAERCSYLIIDEAHHIAADSWNQLREAFSMKPVIQFTATPFRRDGKPVDGKVIYSYPLSRAQSDGYFKPIKFQPVFELRSDFSDQTLAAAAVEKLIDDINNGYDHILMARCSSIDRANEVFIVYRNMAADLNPIMVHSEQGDNSKIIDRINNRDSRIVVCVDMLGEGYDLPQLKIAALHDTHKSLAVLLQFIGRFTRSSGGRLGNATVIANIANQQVTESLERLYSEDADWNILLNEYASASVKEHAEMVNFLENSDKLFESELDKEQEKLSPKMLSPKFSTAIYKTPTFDPKKFYEGLDNKIVIRGA